MSETWSVLIEGQKIRKLDNTQAARELVAAELIAQKDNLGGAATSLYDCRALGVVYIWVSSYGIWRASWYELEALPEGISVRRGGER